MSSPADRPAARRWRSYHLDPRHAVVIAGLRETLAETEVEAERRRMLPERAHRALAAAGLFRVAMPKELGGWDVGPVEEMEVYEALSRISTSACWVVTTGSVYTSWAAAYLSDEAVGEIFGHDGEVVVAGQAPPRGRARVVPGGVRVTGRYGFASGLGQADWVLGGFTMPDGDPAETKAFIVPKEQVEVLDNWHALGIAGSNSVDYAADDLFVPEGFWFSTAKPVPLRGGPRFAAPIAAQVAAAHCGVALGAGERALDELVDQAISVTPTPG
jgi:alkylation response protein AidB-like acyl-CoA dehydrogenase